MQWDDPSLFSVDSTAQQNQDYLASLSSFLDGSSTDFPPSLAAAPPAPALSPSSPHNFLTSTSNSKFNPYSPTSLSDIQINPSLLNHPSNEPSSPELTSASDSGASPASSAGNTSHPPSHLQHNLNMAPAARSAAPPTATGNRRASGGAAHHDKRKAPAQPTGAVKDRKSLGGGVGGGGSHHEAHSHPSGAGEEDDHDEDGRSESPELKGGKGGKTSERRKAQNRQAQRNFRERKEKHLKDLETRVLDLERHTSSQDAENAALKALLEHLQSENARLKAFENVAFDFEYGKDVRGSGAMPVANGFGGLSGLPSVPGAEMGVGGMPVLQGERTAKSVEAAAAAVAVEQPLLTPPTAQDELEDLYSGRNLSGDVDGGFKFDTSLLNFGLSSLSPAGNSASDSTAPSSLFSNSPSISGTTTSAHRQEDDLFASFTLPSPPASHQNSLNSVTSPTTTFGGYRDPLASLEGVQSPGLSTFADLDALFGVTPGSTGGAGGPSPPPLLGASPSMFASSSLSLPPPVPSIPSIPSSSASSTPSLSHSPSAESPTCTLYPALHASLYAQHAGPGGKYEFDLDGLCSEMKLKATCQEAARQALKSAMEMDREVGEGAYPGQVKPE